MQGGGIDSDLNEAGQQQARAFFEYYKETPFVACYSSGLRRTRQTLKPWAEVGLRPVPLLELNELCWGVLEGKQRDPQVNQLLSHAIQTWSGGDTHYAVRGGESPEQVWARLAPRMDYLLQQHTQGNVLICTHGRTLRILLCQLLGYGLPQMQLFAHTNTGLNILRRSGDRFIPELINDTAHLS